MEALWHAWADIASPTNNEGDSAPVKSLGNWKLDTNRYNLLHVQSSSIQQILILAWDSCYTESWGVFLEQIFAMLAGLGFQLPHFSL